MPKEMNTRLTATRFKTSRTVMALILREMSTTYGRTPGGYFWAIMEPLAAIILMSFIFSAFLRSPSLGSNFGLFYATAIMPFMLYNQLAKRVAAALKFSRVLLRYPGVRYFDAILGRFLLTVLTNVTVSFLLLSAIIIIYRIDTILDLRLIFQAFALASLVGLGVGSLNCFLIMRFPLWGSFWSILTTPLFIISCILYIMEDLPAKLRDILWFNPLTHISGLVRSGFFPTYDPSYINIPYVVLFGLTTLAMGLVLLNKFYRDLLNL